MKKIYLIVVAVMGCFLVVFFQNCGDGSFKSNLFSSSGFAENAGETIGSDNSYDGGSAILVGVETGGHISSHPAFNTEIEIALQYRQNLAGGEFDVTSKTDGVQTFTHLNVIMYGEYIELHGYQTSISGSSTCNRNFHQFRMKDPELYAAAKALVFKNVSDVCRAVPTDVHSIDRSPPFETGYTHCSFGERVYDDKGFLSRLHKHIESTPAFCI